MTDHTPEPWRVICTGHVNYIAADRGRRILMPVIAEFAATGCKRHRDYVRIVAAVNHCAGVPTDQLDDGGLLALRQDRDRLLEALREARNALLQHGDERHIAPAVEACDKALQGRQS